MQVLITGGAGFLGAELARRILRAGSLTDASLLDAASIDAASIDAASIDATLITAVAGSVPRLTVLDRTGPPPDIAADPRVRVVVGDLADLGSDAALNQAFDGVDVVVHLAGAVSGDCEADFDLGMAANLAGSLAVLEACRRLGSCPVVVFASSVAVYGCWPGRTLPAVIADDTLPTPRSSYGSQKFVVEQLVNDYTRKGFIDGRTVRLMTVAVRPGKPNGAASGFLSGIVREPLAGIAAVSPVSPNTMVVLSSPDRSIDGLIAAARTPRRDWGPPTAVNLPGVSVSVGDLVVALERVAGQQVASLVRWRPDPAIAAIVEGWPARFDPQRATTLGLTADAGIEAIIRQYVKRVAH